MKHRSKIICFLLILSLSVWARNHHSGVTSLSLGDPNSRIVWVYLTGLNESFYSIGEQHNRTLLDRIGQELHLHIIAVPPNGWCPEFKQKNCWLQETLQDRRLTYDYIQSELSNQVISGMIGFSNGGFFLNQLAQEKELKYPLISIGSAGEAEAHPKKNKLYLLMGKHDKYHYIPGLNFYRDLKGTPLNIEWIEYRGGHEVPEKSLRSLLKKMLYM
jgi:hypothetical protein